MATLNQNPLLQLLHGVESPVPNHYLQEFQQDVFGAEIARSYRGEWTALGWQVDEIIDLRAFHWQSNLSKSDTLPNQEFERTGTSVLLELLKNPPKGTPHFFLSPETARAAFEAMANAGKGTVPLLFDSVFGVCHRPNAAM